MKKNNDIMITIIIPVYNSAEYLEECINSVLGQTFHNIELILINDGSTDISLKIMIQFAKKDKRIRIIDRENKGLVKSRKEGISLARGEYIIFVDSDDILATKAIQTMYDNLIKFGSDAVKISYTQDIKKLSSNDDNIEAIYLNKSEIFDLFTTNKINNIWGTLLKKAYCLNIPFDEINDNISQAEDIMFNMYLYDSIRSMVLIHNNLYYYRPNNSGMSCNINYYSIQKRVNDILLVQGKRLTLTKNKNEYRQRIYAILLYQLFNEIRMLFLNNFNQDKIFDLIKQSYDNDIISNAHKYASGKEIMKITKKLDLKYCPLYYRRYINNVLNGEYNSIIQYGFYIKIGKRLRRMKI